MSNIIPLPRISVQYISTFTKEKPELWQDEALCAEIGSELFFQDAKGGVQYREARKICSQCSVLEDCRENILRIEGSVNKEQRHGFWGGLSPRERLRLAKERGLLEEVQEESQELHAL